MDRANPLWARRGGSQILDRTTKVIEIDQGTSGVRRDPKQTNPQEQRTETGPNGLLVLECFVSLEKEQINEIRNSLNRNLLSFVDPWVR